jgi:hypothetical protein
MANISDEEMKRISEGVAHIRERVEIEIIGEDPRAVAMALVRIAAQTAIENGASRIDFQNIVDAAWQKASAARA